MTGIRVLLGCLVICSMTGRLVSAQIVERTADGELQFTDSIIGSWEIDEVVAAGRTTSESYGPSVFTKNSWTVQTRNGDHVYNLKEINGSSNSLEVTFEHSLVQDRSFKAYVSLEDEKLSIVRGLGLGNPLPLPDTMNEGPNTLVYKFKRGLDATPVLDDTRVPVHVHLVDDANASQVLVDVTLKPNFGGNFGYSSEPRRVSESQQEPSQVGTAVRGRIKATGSGEWAVMVEIEIINREHSDDATTSVIRSEKLRIDTLIRGDKPTRIQCGGNRTCEITRK
jgi:hypothetical protein